MDPHRSNGNQGSRMSLVTINEGDLTAGGVRLSERGYSNIKSIEGQ